METVYHIPAMLEETLQGLITNRGGIYVDVTLGGGGHSRAILERLGVEGRLFSFDQDKEAIANALGDRGTASQATSVGETACAPISPMVRHGGRLSFSAGEDACAPGHSVDETACAPISPMVRHGGRLSFSAGEDACAPGHSVRETPASSVAMPCSQWQLVHGNFRYLTNFMDYYGVEQVDGVLADLGVSFHHFDTPERGFSFRFDAPLDMRMNQQGGKTAADIVNSYDEENLARVLYIYGEMKNARQIARRIVKARSLAPITMTEQFAEICQVPKKDMAQLFQALRIEVNDEMGALREMLEGALQLLKPGGRLAILTYHSLEDRMVKNFLRAGNIEGTIEKDFYGNILTPFRVIEKGRQASPEEVARNPRSRSARLRVGEKK